MEALESLFVVQTDQGPMSADQLFDTLYFSSYCANRDAGMTPAQYGSLVKVDLEAFEKRYQALRRK